MQSVPERILTQFNAVLKEKALPVSLHEDYRKWLRYYLDYRAKYPLPDARSEQVRSFIEKMRSKGQSGKSLAHAAHVLSLLFLLEAKSKNTLMCSEPGGVTTSSPVAASTADNGPPPALPAPDGTPVSQAAPAAQLPGCAEGNDHEARDHPHLSPQLRDPFAPGEL